VDSIRENLDRLGDLSPEELQALQDQIVTEFGTLSESVGDTPTREAVDAMNELADANDVVIGEQGRRVAEASELAAAAEEAKSRFNGDDATAEGEGDISEEGTNEVTETELAATDDEEEDPADAEGSPSEEEGETPADEDEEKKKKDLKPFSADSEVSSEAVVDAPAEAEASVEEAPEADAVVAAAEAEAAVEEAPEAESAPETPIEIVEEDSTEESTTESSEEPVTASNTPEFEAPEELRPSIKAAAPVVITAGADLPGITAGSELSSISDVAQAILTRKHGMGRTSGGDGEQHSVATFSTTFPAERMLNANDIEGNRSKVNAVVAPEAIIAAGGLTAPVETSYDIFELGETSVRPVRDALAVFGADRGGIRFMTPPVLADLKALCPYGPCRTTSTLPHRKLRTPSSLAFALQQALKSPSTPTLSRSALPSVTLEHAHSLNW
jgi:chemotaxis protein histidine kinase CheA